MDDNEKKHQFFFNLDIRATGLTNLENQSRPRPPLVKGQIKTGQSPICSGPSRNNMQADQRMIIVSPNLDNEIKKHPIGLSSTLNI